MISPNKALKAKKEISMNSNQDKLNGLVNSAVGSAKEAVGKVTGNKNLEAEGATQKTKGQIQKLSGSVKDVVQNGKDLLGIKSNKD